MIVQAQRCAVLEFKANVGVSQQDVDGISAIFITYFQPAGYTMVERTQINKVIEEQGFQRSNLTESQMVRVGKILNVSKIVVGDVNVVMGQYNVDVRVINVESGTIAATEGATFAGSSYRTSMQSIAQKLASKIAIMAGPTVKAPSSSTSAAPKKRTTVTVLYGYLKVFPNELGTFTSEPSSVISQINTQAQYGYNNWRIPTNEELSLLRANNYLGSGDYMTRENRRGIVLLVTDGKDVKTIQAEERERQEQDRIRKEEQERIKREEKERAERIMKETQERIERENQQRRDALIAQGWVDLGLPSGTLWKSKDEVGYYTYDDAVRRFGGNLPTKEQFEELLSACQWISHSDYSYSVFPPNGKIENFVCLELNNKSGLNCDGYPIPDWGMNWGRYWTSTKDGSDQAWLIYGKSLVSLPPCFQFSVRLVQTF